MQPIDKNFTPVEYDPQYILMVNQLKKYFPIKGGMVGKTVGQVKACLLYTSPSPRDRG